MVVAYVILAFLIGGIVMYIIMNRAIAKETVQVSELSAELKAKTHEIDVLKDSHEKVIGSLKTEHDKQIESLNTEHDKQMSIRAEQFNAQLRAATEKISNIGKAILEENSERLKKSNAESMDTITAPLKEAIGNMQKAINENTKDSAAQAAAFREQIKSMIESNRVVGERAASLTNVLRRDNATVGNMGEVILGELLNSQGLKEGRHYDVQPVIKDSETGQNLRPDIILHYPQGQDAIIDSKVSISAYQRYVNATSDEDRKRFLEEHLQSIRRHVRELSAKDYSKYIKKPRTSVDFVIMFVPFESSLQLALANDPTLWSDAFESKVFITGEQNLAGILHIIHMAWVQNDRTENYEKVFKVAEQLLDRLGDFVKRYEDVGEAIEKCNKAYEKSTAKLLTGNQSVVKKGRELVDLGAKENATRRIPEPEPDLFITPPDTSSDTPAE